MRVPFYADVCLCVYRETRDYAGRDVGNCAGRQQHRGE